MKNVFVEGLSSHIKFEAALKRARSRGAAEANWVLCEGDVGCGKSRTLARFAVVDRHPHIRAKAGWTPNWMCNDICAALNIAASQRTRTMINDITGYIQSRGTAAPYLVIDELNLAARKVEVLETLRDISDTSETLVIAGANRGTYTALSSNDRVQSRVVEVVPFGPLTPDDMRIVCKALTDVKLADDIQQAILRETGGRMRAVRNVIARIEERMRTTREPITLDLWGKRPLTADHEANFPKLVANNA